jgi:hypothetical protein
MFIFIEFFLSNGSKLGDEKAEIICYEPKKLKILNFRDKKKEVPFF